MRSPISASRSNFYQQSWWFHTTCTESALLPDSKCTTETLWLCSSWSLSSREWTSWILMTLWPSMWHHPQDKLYTFISAPAVCSVQHIHIVTIAATSGARWWDCRCFSFQDTHTHTLCSRLMLIYMTCVDWPFRSQCLSSTCKDSLTFVVSFCPFLGGEANYVRQVANESLLSTAA